MVAELLAGSALIEWTRRRVWGPIWRRDGPNVRDTRHASVAARGSRDVSPRAVAAWSAVALAGALVALTAWGAIAAMRELAGLPPAAVGARVGQRRGDICADAGRARDRRGVDDPRWRRDRLQPTLGGTGAADGADRRLDTRRTPSSQFSCSSCLAIPGVSASHPFCSCCSARSGTSCST